MQRKLLRPLVYLALLVTALAGCAEEVEVVPAPTGLTTAVFDPSADPVEVPTPTDLAIDQTTGLLAVPVADATTKPGQAYFDSYLNTLNGYPTASTAEVRFDGELDPQTVNEKTIVVLETDLVDPAAISPVTGLTITYHKVEATDGGKATSRVTIANPAGWTRAKRYVFFVLGGESGVKNTAGKPVIRSVLFELAAGEDPLCAWDAAKSWDADSGKCTAPAQGATAQGCCTFNYSGLIESTVKKEVRAGAAPGLDTEFVEVQVHKKVLETATDFERLRRAFQQLLALGTAAAKIPADKVAVVWSFKTVDQSEILYDPTAGVLPYPNDILRDPTTGKVNIPASANETPAEKALREGLNTMDGFTTQGTYFVPYAGKIDPKTATGAMIAVEAATGAMVGMEFKVDETAGAITAKPMSPLKEKTTYAIVMLSQPKEGSQMAGLGLADDKGRYVVPSTFMGLIKSPHPLYDETAKKSLVSTLDDATAQLIEQARLGHKPLFDGLAAQNFKREDIACAWAFTTMSITDEMQQLRALPYSVLGALDANSPTLTGALDTTLSSWPTTYMVAPKTGVGGIVASGTYKSVWALDAATGAFNPDPTQYQVVDVPFILTVPTGTAPATGWPVVVYVQSILQSKKEMLVIASANAQKGMATISFDQPYHGERSWCVKDDECAGAGTCDTSTGKCSTQLADADGNGIVDASGNEKYIALSNPFAIRDNLRQGVIDASALLRAVVLGGASGITGGTVKLDPTKVTIAGYSLGAIVATTWLAVEGNAARAALNSPGLRTAEIFIAPNAGTQWASYKQAVFQGQGVTEGTLAAIQLVTTFQWILEPADPGNFARHIKQEPLDDLVKPGSKVPAKELIIQQAENDEGVPVRFSDPLAKAIGVDTTDTFYKGQEHSFFKLGSPDANATQACRTQMATFLADGTVCKPAMSGSTYTGQCN